jgi:hypothetical protein
MTSTKAQKWELDSADRPDRGERQRCAGVCVAESRNNSTLLQPASIGSRGKTGGTAGLADRLEIKGASLVRVRTFEVRIADILTVMAFSAANVMPHEAGASHYETASVDAGGQRGEVQANHPSRVA